MVRPTLKISQQVVQVCVTILRHFALKCVKMCFMCRLAFMRPHVTIFYFNLDLLITELLVMSIQLIIIFGIISAGSNDKVPNRIVTHLRYFA